MSDAFDSAFTVTDFLMVPLVNCIVQVPPSSEKFRASAITLMPVPSMFDCKMLILATCFTTGVGVGVGRLVAVSLALELADELAELVSLGVVIGRVF